MSWFNRDVTEEEYNEAIKDIQIAEYLFIDGEKERCTKIIEQYKQQQADTLDNLRTGLKATIGFLKTVLPKKFTASIPDNIIDVAFGFIASPETLLDLMNTNWESLCYDWGIPSQNLRILQQKPGNAADLEVAIGVYNPNLCQWIYTEVNLRDMLETVKHRGALGAPPSVKQIVVEAYTRKTDNTALNQSNG